MQISLMIDVSLFNFLLIRMFVTAVAMFICQQFLSSLYMYGKASSSLINHHCTKASSHKQVITLCRACSSITWHDDKSYWKNQMVCQSTAVPLDL